MLRILGIAVLVLAVAAGGLAYYAYDTVRTLEVEQVAPDVWVIFGVGGNVGVLRTDAGAVVVDTMTFEIQGEEIRELAEELGGGPVQAIINTHYHGDHTHGNPAFAEGTPVFATDKTRERLIEFDSAFWHGAAARLLPRETFSDERALEIGGKRMRLIYLGRGHTDGDLVVLFEDSGVLHMGDLLFARRYPNIDLEAGGSLKRWIATLDGALALEFGPVIPGHGPVTDRDGILAYQRFLKELWEVGSTAARDGRTLEQTLAEAELREDDGYETIGVPLLFRLDRDFVVRRAWEEATGAVR